MNRAEVVNDNIWIIDQAGFNLANFWILSHPQASEPWVIGIPTTALFEYYKDGRHPLSLISGPYRWDMPGFLGFIARLCTIQPEFNQIPLSLRGSNPIDGMVYHISLTRTMNNGLELNKLLGWDEEKFDRWIRYHLTFDRKEA